MSDKVYTIIDGVRTVHMTGGVSDYDTSCGIDMNDPLLGQLSENIGPTKDKINCDACIRIWIEARKYCHSDFKLPVRYAPSTDVMTEPEGRY